MAYKCISRLARLWPASSHDHGPHVHLQTRSITASKLAPSWPPNAYLQTCSITTSKCISRPARLRPLSSSPDSLDYGLQVHLETCSITASKFALSWPPSAYLITRSITTSKCISRLARLRPPSSHEHGLQGHLQTRLITISECISKFTRSGLSSVSPNMIDHPLQVHL